MIIRALEFYNFLRFFDTSTLIVVLKKTPNRLGSILGTKLHW